MNNCIEQALTTFPKSIRRKDVVFLCIGTDRSTGDSLAPLIGSKLKQLGYDNVIGTLDEPVHAMNLVDTMRTLPTNKRIIAIDACLGQHSNVGKIHIRKGALKPGAGVGKNLPEVGDYNITGIVNVGGFMEYFVLQNTRLSMVFGMADEIVDVIKSRFPVRKRR